MELVVGSALQQQIIRSMTGNGVVNGRRWWWWSWGEHQRKRIFPEFGIEE